MPDVLIPDKGERNTPEVISSLPPWVHLRPYHSADRSSVFGLLRDLPDLYPSGLAWLDRKLDEVEEGKASCTLATVDKWPVGILIETPKGARRKKLSTLYVSEPFRGMGIGTSLLESSRERWVAKSLDHVYITVASRMESSVAPLLSKYDFGLITTEPQRYGVNRDELIYGWYR